MKYDEIDALIEECKTCGAMVPRRKVMALIKALLILRTRLYEYEFSKEKTL